MNFTLYTIPEKVNLRRNVMVRRIVFRKLNALVIGAALLVGLGSGRPASAIGIWDLADPAEFATGVQKVPANSILNSVSCATAWNCTTVGSFYNQDGDQEAFTQSSTDGVWSEALPVVFAAGVASNAPSAELKVVSCASVGNCTAGGAFATASGGREAFTMTSTNGVWGQATPAVFASGVQNSTPDADVKAVQCVSVGNCTAVGRFTTPAGGGATGGFTMTLTNGVWGQALPVVFASGVQNAVTSVGLESVSCASAGNCTAVGFFDNPLGSIEAFTVTSTNGVWAQARPAVFASGIQNASQTTYLESVSCASADNCTAAGNFRNTSGDVEAFTMTLTNGVWEQGRPAVFATGIQNSNPDGRFNDVRCSTAGNCIAVGRFKNASGDMEAFTMTSTNGVWGQGTPVVFASGVQNSTPNDNLRSISCATSDSCTAVGNFKNATGGTEAFTVSMTNSVWGQGTPAVFANGVQNSALYAQFRSVSCATANDCTTVGFFNSAAGGYEAVTMWTVNPNQATPTTVATSTTVASPGPETSEPSVLPETGTDGLRQWLIGSLFAFLAGAILIVGRRRAPH